MTRKFSAEGDRLSAYDCTHISNTQHISPRFCLLQAEIPSPQDPDVMTGQTSPKTRVAIVYTHFPHYRRPVFEQLGRSDRYAFEFFYDSGGVDGTIRSAELADNGHPIRTYMIKSLMFQPGFLPYCLWGGFDAYVFLGNPHILTTWFFAPILHLRRKRIAFWTHGWIHHERGLKAGFRSAFYRLADMLLLYGNPARKIGLAKGFGEKRLQIIYNSLDYPRQKTIRDACKESGGEIKTPYFLCVSRLVEEIELDLAIEAIAELAREQGLAAELVIVGDGPARAALEEQAEQHRAPVRFLGAIYQEERLANLFINCTAVISPGKVGLLAIHALAYGAPVITHGDMDHQMPEVEAIIPGRTGQFFKRGDIGELSVVMKHYLTTERNEAERKLAIETIEQHWNPAVQRQLIEQALDQLMRESDA